MTAATELIEATALFRSLAVHHPAVEVWPDDTFAEGGWAYFWIVSRTEGTVRCLTYVRRKGIQFQQRAYDTQGEELWVDAE
jgi:hypothetical protein